MMHNISAPWSKYGGSKKAYKLSLKMLILRKYEEVYKFCGNVGEIYKLCGNRGEYALFIIDLGGMDNPVSLE